MRALKTALLTGALIAAGTTWASAQDVTMRLHQMLPSQATIPAKAITPWIEKVEKDSGGKIKIEKFDTMALGGKPPELVDQVRDGVVDIIWTVIGYTPGRFPSTEVYELPFMMTNGEETSRAMQRYCEEFCMDDFKDYKVIAWHAHGPGIIHSADPVNKLEDMDGMKVRGGSRVTNQMLEKLGAFPIGMPVTAVAEALSKGVINGTTIPYEVMPAFKVQELVKNHTGFSGDNGLYTQTFVFAMNKNTYENLPDDLKKVIDDNSGTEVAAAFGRAMDTGDAAGLKLAQETGNVITLDEAETQRWKDVAEPLINDWAKEMDDQGRPGTEMVEKARAYLKEESDKADSK